MALVVLGAMVSALLVGCPAKVLAVPKVTVAVLPFSNSTGEPRFDVLSSGFSDLVASALSRNEGVVVVDREHLYTIADELGLSLTNGLTQERAPRVGRLLGAEIFIKGGFTYIDDRFKANVHAFDVETSALVYSGERVGSLEGLAELSALLATDVARGISRRLEEPIGLAPDPSSELSLHFMQGMSYYYSQLHDHAVAEFMRLLHLDPANEEARYWIAKSYVAGDAPMHARIELEIFLEEFPRSARAPEVAALLATLGRP